MEGHTFNIYNKCLFRTISLVDLKLELTSHQVGFHQSDSYYILTLRLRREILLRLKMQPAVIEQLTNELNIYDKSKFKECSTYKCCVPGCYFRSFHHRQYISHLERAHYNGYFTFVCNYKHSCSRTFGLLGSLKFHIKQEHSQVKSSVMLNQLRLLETLLDLRCPKNSCGNQKVTSLKMLKSHIYSHLTAKESMSCPYCSYATNITGTMKCHINRKHAIQTVDIVSNVYLSRNENEFVEAPSQLSSASEVNLAISIDEPEESSNTHELNVDIEDEECCLSEDVFMRALANTFNTWMNISGVAYSTVNMIVKEVFNSYDRGMEFIREKILAKLRKTSVNLDEVENALSEMEKDNIFEKAKSELLSEFKRKNYILSNFPNVQPITVKLNDTAEGKKETYQYVPIEQSLKILLEDETYLKQKIDDPYYHEENIFKDSRDGTMFRSNPFFKRNPEAIPLVVFQDELEVGNDSAVYNYLYSNHMQTCHVPEKF